MGRELQMICGIIPLPSLRSIYVDLWNESLVRDRICRPILYGASLDVRIVEATRGVDWKWGFNCPSISPWGVPVLFVRKENGS